MSKVLQYVEIDVDRCSLTYGVAPCTASIPTTGAIKCFNSLGTCQDRENFNNVPVTLRFAVDCDYLPDAIPCIPTIAGISLSPGSISLGQDLGTRSSLTVTFNDAPHSDAGTAYDKYPETRGYDPYKRGTYWGKFRARNPYLIGRNLRLIRGLVGQALEDMETRHYVIESFSGPSPANTFSIIAKDVLKLASGDRAQAPKLSGGRLFADLTNVATSATLAPSGIGAAEYPASGFVCIGGREVCAFTRVGNVLTLTRGQLGTTAVAHNEEDRVQLVVRHVSADPADIIYDLLVNYAGVDPAFIQLPSWQTETGTFLQQLYTGTITEPTSVEDLINEIIEQAALVLWWDDIAQLIRLQVLRGIVPNAQRYDENNMLEGTLAVEDQPSLRISHVYTYFSLRDPTKSLTDEDNYAATVLSFDADASANYGVPAIKKIFSRWIPFGGRAIAIKVGDIVLARYKNAPRRVGFELFREHEDIQIGTGYRLSDWSMQDATGEREEITFQVTRLNPKPDKYTVEGEELLFDLGDTGGLNDRIIYIDSNASNVNLRTVHDSFYPAPTLGDVGTVTVTCIIETDVVVSSTLSTLRAFDVGDWPFGLEIIVEFRGTVKGGDGNGGKGGNGGSGNGSASNGGNGSNGSAGGVAFYTRKAVKVRGLTGKIWGGRGGGGGGSGGGGARGQNPGGQTYDSNGSGGGGGGSYATPGARGNAGSSGSGGSNGVAGGTPNGGNGGADPPTNGYTNAGGGGKGGNAGSDYGVAGQNGLPGTQGFGNMSGTKNPGSVGLGGPGGPAIDGVSFVTFEETPGDIRGATIN
jgi:hypothetical protein